MWYQMWDQGASKLVYVDIQSFKHYGLRQLWSEVYDYFSLNDPRLEVFILSLMHDPILCKALEIRYDANAGRPLYRPETGKIFRWRYTKSDYYEAPWICIVTLEHISQCSNVPLLRNWNSRHLLANLQ